MYNDLHDVGAVVLSAGKGTRLGVTDKPKVMYTIGEKPMVSFIVDTLILLGFSHKQICLVVGFGQQIVRDYFDDKVSYAIQEQQKGTAHAAYTGMKTLSPAVEHVLVVAGDDSAFYSADTIAHFISQHKKSRAVLSLLSVYTEHPEQLGRIVRRANGLIEIIEKEYVTEAQKNISEVSTGTFMFNRQWFETMYPHMPPLRRINEYGLPTSLSMAQSEGLSYQIISLKNPDEWFGVNTPEELKEADRRKSAELHSATIKLDE
ncbi:MAG: NTP transferase domain-containing protein [bacterium]|nr:NTP transferase domain-containing protein [bacterium]